MATILRLPDSTIQMIAAGEVITRPVNVVKELLENSLDAGSTNIRITIDDGGLKLIEVMDNGHGIARADAELLCRRHSTSKLNSADDLSRLTTFGFRGEALASISEMAELEVRTHNPDVDNIGWRAKYRYGKLESEPQQRFKPSPGTQLRVVNLFSNVRQRKKSMQSTSERRSITDLVIRYALHHRDEVTMSLKEKDLPDLICLLAPLDIKPCVGMLFGSDMEANLVEVEVRNYEQFKVFAQIYFTYKKSTGTFNQSTFILFVNDRLVECLGLKREIEALLSDYMNFKQNVCLTYISLTVPPEDVDVNTHPAKATVALHYQEEIFKFVASALRAKLQESLSTRLMGAGATQTKAVSALLTSSQKIAINTPQAEPVQQTPCPKTPIPMARSPNHIPSPSVKRQYDLIHTDSSQKTLKQLTGNYSSLELIAPKRQRRNLQLKSIHDLRYQVAKEKATSSVKPVKNSVFVGIFDHDRALIQHDTRLYAINLKAYLKEQFYQFYLFDFGNFPPIEILPPGNKIRFLIDTYLEDIRKHEPETYKTLIFKETQSIIAKLLTHADMFEDYLTLKLTKDEVITLPCIMPDEVPNLTFLGKFLVDLANNVDYTEERECLRMIGRIIADFYSEAPSNLKDRDVHRKYHDLVETKLYVAIKNYLLIPEWLFTRENICQISDTKDLYKVFERC